MRAPGHSWRKCVEQVKKTARSTSTLKFSDPESVMEGESKQEDEVQNDSLNSDSNRSLVEKSAKRKRVNSTDPFVLYVSELEKFR